MKYDIFISYKRLGVSSATAAVLYQMLQQKGYNVFFDRKEMRSGKFNEQLLEHIGNATDVIILLEEASLGSWFNYRPRPRKENVLVGEGDSFGDNDSMDASDLDSGIKEEPYKSDWFCKEVMYSLTLKGKNIIPILLGGYHMPEGKDLPMEMKGLSEFQALDLDISEVTELIDDYLVGKGYLHSKPANLSMSMRFQSKGGIVGCYLFYTEATSCDVYECGEQITTLTEDDNEWHPFRYPVNFAGEHRFKAVNVDSCEVVTISSTVETNCQKYVPVRFTDTTDLWKLTKEVIDKQSPSVLFRWGMGLFDGTSKHEPDIALSFVCLQQAIKKGSEDALTFVCSHGSGLVSEKHAPFEVAIKWYRFAADHGNKDAQCNLGRAYSNGDGVEKDYTKAFEWFSKAAVQGDVYSQWKLGYLYSMGIGVASSDSKAFEWYSKAAGQGDAVSQRCLGIMYLRGRGVEKDAAKAFDWFLKAAGQGDAIAQRRVAMLYYVGDGVKKDYKKAFEWFTKAAGQGSKEAFCYLGDMYFNGKGRKKDYASALEWYEKAAEQGVAYAWRKLGTMYREGFGVTQDYVKALEWYTKAAEQGDIIAQRLLGNLYRDGLGAGKDYAKALELYTKSAEQGDTVSLRLIGMLYSKGLGVDQSYEKALEWYHKAAEKGSKSALNSIAWTYHLMGDYEKALPWAEKAIAASPDDPIVIDTLATVYEGLGRYEDALAQFEKCLKLLQEGGKEEQIKETTEKIEALKEKMKG